MADLAKLETFNAAFGKMAQAKKLLDDALVQFDIFVHANRTNPDAQEFFDITQKAVNEIRAAREALEGQKTTTDILTSAIVGGKKRFRGVNKARRSADMPVPAQPYLRCLTRSNACPLPEPKSCPLYRVFPPARDGRANLVELESLADFLSTASKFPTTPVVPKPEPHSTSAQAPRHDINSDTETLLAIFSGIKPALTCSNLARCLNRARLALRQRNSLSRLPSSTSLMVVSDTIIPKNDKCKEDR